MLAPGKYNLCLGASGNGDRLNALYKENIAETGILSSLRDLRTRYSQERTSQERFGDFVVRKGVVRAMLVGRDFRR